MEAQEAFRLALRDWLRTTELEPSTRKTYEMYVRKYIEPALGLGPLEAGWREAEGE